MSTQDFKMSPLPQEASYSTANFRMNRRHLLTRVASAGLAGAVLATVSFPARAWASLDTNSKTAQANAFQQSQSAFYAAIFEQSSSPAWVARHGLTADQYQQTFNQLVGQGYRPLLVDGYGVNGQAFYAAIFEQSSSPPWVARHGLTADQYQQTFNQLVGQGYRLLWVSGYGV